MANLTDSQFKTFRADVRREVQNMARDEYEAMQRVADGFGVTA